VRDQRQEFVLCPVESLQFIVCLLEFFGSCFHLLLEFQVQLLRGFLGPLAPADVARDALVARDLPICIAENRGVHLTWNLSAVLVDAFDFSMVGVLSGFRCLRRQDPFDRLLQ